MSIPVLSVAQMREWEQATWDAGITEEAVIRQVGEKIASNLLELVDHDRAILFVAGKGNNGEDVRKTQTALTEQHPGVWDTALIDVVDPVADLPKLDQALAGLRDGVIVDGLFGIGLNRPLGEDWIQVIERLNAADASVISIDSPSGLDSDTGAVHGAAICAELTLTLGAPKRGLLKARAIQHVGRLYLVSEIGLVCCPSQSELQWNCFEDFEGYPPRRRVDAHKGSHGHVAIVAGSVGYHGAAVLAADAALSACPGLVSVYTSEACYVPVASQLQAAMVHPWSGKEGLPANCTAVVIGPGLANSALPGAVKESVIKLWTESTLTVIADASALPWLPEGATPAGSIRLITPHPGEAARMLAVSTEDVQQDRCGAVRKLSERHGGCWVVLKGSQTLVGRAEGDIFVNPTGNPWLAQGGSGDVLAGYLGGLLAQPILARDPLAAIRFAVWDHGRVSDAHAGRSGPLNIAGLARSLGCWRDD